MRNQLLNILCCATILLLVLYQGILVGIMHVISSLATDAADAGAWLGRYRVERLQKGGE